MECCDCRWSCEGPMMRCFILVFVYHKCLNSRRLRSICLMSRVQRRSMRTLRMVSWRWRSRVCTGASRHNMVSNGNRIDTDGSLRVPLHGHAIMEDELSCRFKKKEKKLIVSVPVLPAQECEFASPHDLLLMNFCGSSASCACRSNHSSTRRICSYSNRVDCGTSFISTGGGMSINRERWRADPWGNEQGNTKPRHNNPELTRV